MPVFQCDGCEPETPCIFINQSPRALPPPDCPYNEGERPVWRELGVL
jgi:hypothetical protein